MTEFLRPFIAYPHLERFGTDAVDGINIGDVHIFPKLDGTNASVWLENGAMQCGSRTRILSVENDNAGFCQQMNENSFLDSFIRDYPHLRLYGEFLVPHSLKTYRADAWRKFWIFDVLDMSTGQFMHYDQYSVLMKEYGLDYIPAIATGRNPDYETLCGWRDRNTFLIDENMGIGEGIVIKRYGFQNKWGHTTWAKMVTNTFKDKHVLEMGGSVINTKIVEEEIANEFLTPEMIDKVVAKIRNAKATPVHDELSTFEGYCVEPGPFEARDIPRLLSTCFHDLVTEELWEAIKKHRNPKIDFKTLQTCAYNRVKEVKKELFGR